MIHTFNPRFCVFVKGRPAPQGSKSAFVPKDKQGRNLPYVQPQMIEASKSTKPWRKTVMVACSIEVLNNPTLYPITTDVNLAAVFVFQRGVTQMGTGRNAGVVKASAPPLPTTGSQGDLSKLVRAVEDSMTDAGVWLDDKLVASYDGTMKRYADPGEAEGVYITVTKATQLQGAPE